MCNIYAETKSRYNTLNGHYTLLVTIRGLITRYLETENKLCKSHLKPRKYYILHCTHYYYY